MKKQIKKYTFYQIFDYLEISKAIELSVIKSKKLRNYLSQRLIKNLPNSDELMAINKLVSVPDFALNDYSEELKALWKYRYVYIHRKDFFIKILHSVKFGGLDGEGEALNIMNKCKSIGIEDILYLLSADLNLNLFYASSSLKLSQNAIRKIRNFAVSILDVIDTKKFAFTITLFTQMMRFEELSEESRSLRNYLINRCRNSTDLTTLFYWSLNIEAESANILNKIYKETQSLFVESLDEKMKSFLDSQIALRKLLLSHSYYELFPVPEDRPNSKSYQMILEKNLEKINFEEGEMLSLPFNLEWKVKKIFPELCSVVKSVHRPVQYTCRLTNNEDMEKRDIKFMFKYEKTTNSTIFNDEIMTKIIAFLKSAIEEDGIDLSMPIYKFICMSRSDALVELVPNSQSAGELSRKVRLLECLNSLKILKEYGKIDLDNYINSYSSSLLICYVLGVRDRHFENILITEDMKVFNIDFSYILGNDPIPSNKKQWTDPDFVEFMRRETNENYLERFKSRCLAIFHKFRKYRRLLVNIFHSLIHSSIYNLNTSNYKQVLEDLNERLFPSETDEEANANFLKVIEECFISQSRLDNINTSGWTTYFR